MVKKMPLPPPAEDSTGQQPEHGSQPKPFLPGFAGVVTKVPKGVRTPIDFSADASSSAQTEDSRGVASVPAELPTQGEFEVDIPVGLIDVSPYQPRRSMDEDALNRLADSLQDGQINAIVVRGLANGRYELIAGERRWRATKLLGRATIRAVVRVMTDAEAELVAVADNDAREDLTDFDRACAYKSLLDKGIVASQSELARRTGKERTFIVRCMSFFRLPADACKFLEVRRDLIGATNAGNFAALAEANKGQDTDIVVEAIRKIFDGKLDVASALLWAKTTIRHRHNPVPAKRIVTWDSKGKRLGDVRVAGNRVVITCAEGVTPDELVKKILGERSDATET